MTLALNDVSARAEHSSLALQSAQLESSHSELGKLHELCASPNSSAKAAGHSGLVASLCAKLAAPPNLQSGFAAWLSLTTFVHRILRSGALDQPSVFVLLHAAVPALVSVLARWSPSSTPDSAVAPPDEVRSAC